MRKWKKNQRNVGKREKRKAFELERYRCAKKNVKFIKRTEEKKTVKKIAKKKKQS